MKYIAAILMTLFMSVSLAEEPNTFDYSDFARIPILHDGRIKPLDSFARVMLKRISGDTSNKTSSSQWLARVLFDPSDAINEPIFFVHSQELMHTLLLPARADEKYSFSELAGAFATHTNVFSVLREKDKRNLSPQEQELVVLFNNVNEFADMMGTFSLLKPLPNIDKDTRHRIGIDAEGSVTYLSLMKVRKEIEIKSSKLNTRLMLMEATDKDNMLVRVIPPSWEGSDEWLSPWAVIEKGVGSPQNSKLFADWQILAAAYEQGDALAWQHESSTLLAAGVQGQGARSWALSLEVLYNKFNLLNVSLIVYTLGFGLAVLGLLRHARFLVFSYVVLCVGAVLHGLAIASRMAILMRPPVSTLYESMIFVSFVTVLFGLWLERKRKEADGLLISSIVACLLLMAANVFAGNTDTLEVLVAVLNTNFWLGTHVVCITTGYGSSLIAGTLAHIYLFKRALGKTSADDLMTLEKRIHAVGLVALLFTAVGTMLGGIWADQSWGRFWGWDPKENGALLIVLWLIWLLHARIAKQTVGVGFAVAMALINIVVALAWVGVNLLSVGLHSYGFTDMAANGLLSFCGFELAFIMIARVVIFYRERPTSAGIA